jgi:hypothetical protein
VEQIDLPLSKDERRISRTVELFRKIWGRDHEGLRFLGSPHEGDYRNDAELILHELAHQAIIPSTTHFAVGYLRDAWEEVAEYISMRPVWEQDMHEIYAIAVELGVGQRLRMRLHRHHIVKNSMRNLQMDGLKRCNPKIYRRFIRRASKLERVQFAVDMIVGLVEKARKDFCTKSESQGR